MAARKGYRMFRWLVGTAGTILLAETALVVAVFVSPDAGTRVRTTAEKVSRAWTGTKKEPGLSDRITDAAQRAYREVVRPLWGEAPAGQRKPAFARCVTCHREYASTTRFGSVYLDHSQHAQLGVACQTCHTDVEHPNPPRVEESACASCHDRDIRTGGTCTLCHAPGALAHFYTLGYPREGPVNCNSCHRPGAFTGGSPKLLVRDSFNGSDVAVCQACHTTAKCAYCHAEKHPKGWASTHGATIVFESQGLCFQCHSGTYCADRCHSVPPASSYRPRPLPTGRAP